MKLPLKAQLIVLLAFILFLGFTVYFFNEEVESIRNRKPLPIIAELPNFSLTDQNGNSVALSNLEDKVWVANFIFTRCEGPCPLMTGKFASLQHEIVDKFRIKLVSFSVDPEYDTPVILKEYGDRYGAIKDVWYFLTGTKEEIYSLATEGFKLPVLGKSDERPAILHSDRFVLVDKWGRIRGYYKGLETKEYRRLLRDTNRLLAEPTPA